MKEVHLSESNFLLSAIQRGDQKAFDALFRRYYPALCAYGHRFVDLEDAEEIVQDSLFMDLGKQRKSDYRNFT